MQQLNYAAIKKCAAIAQRLSDIASSYADHKKTTHLSIIEHNRLNNVHGVSSQESHRLGRVQMRINRCADIKAQTSYRQLMENKHSLRWIKG